VQARGKIWVQEDPMYVKSQMLMQTMKVDPETTINHCQKLHEETDEIAKLDAKTSSQVKFTFPRINKSSKGRLIFSKKIGKEGMHNV
jgi:hypothetical protein